MIADEGDGLYVIVRMTIEAKGGGPDQLIEQLIAERNNYYPEWEFDSAEGIVISTLRMHASMEHSATATLTRLVKYRGPQPGD